MATNLLEADAKQLEIKLIAEYHTCILDEDCWGYNVTRGGEGGQKYLTAEEHHEAYMRAYKKANKKSYQRLKADEDRYSTLLEYNRTNKRNKLNNPEKHEKLKAYNRQDMRLRRQDAEYAEKQRAAHRATSKKVTAVRQELSSLYKLYPELFASDDINYIFERGKNGWTNQSLKKLTIILTKVKNLIDLYK